MRYLLWLVLCLALGLFGVAFADEMDDEDSVVREEHTAPPADKQDKEQPATHDHTTGAGNPPQMGDDSQMGAYFGLGDEYIWGGSAGWDTEAGLPGSRMIPSNPPPAKQADKAEVQEAAQHTAEQQAEAVGFDPENHTLLRRGAGHDYFYD